MNTKAFVGALLILVGAFVALLAGGYSVMIALPYIHNARWMEALSHSIGSIIPCLIGIGIFSRGKRLYTAADGATETVSPAGAGQRRKAVIYLLIVVAGCVLMFGRAGFTRVTLVTAAVVLVSATGKLFLTFLETSGPSAKDGFIETDKKPKDIMKDI